MRSKGKKKHKELDFPLTALEPHVLLPPILCQYCGAKKFEHESEGFCCSAGKIVLKLHDVPADLYELYTSASLEAGEFRANIRIYNSSFAFTSLGVKYDKTLCAMSKGIYTFRVQGQMYHFINPIMPPENPPTYLQLYFHDTEHELENRLNFSDRMTLPILAKLSSSLKANPYCQFFRSLGNVPNLEDHGIKINSDPGLDQRVFNAPSVSQVAAVWVANANSDVEGEIRDIVVHCHDGKSHKINYFFGCYDPLNYPLLFPHGEVGWHQGIQKLTRSLKSSMCIERVIDAHELVSSCELMAAEKSGILAYLLLFSAAFYVLFLILCNMFRRYLFSS